MRNISIRRSRESTSYAIPLPLFALHLFLYFPPVHLCSLLLLSFCLVSRSPSLPPYLSLSLFRSAYALTCTTVALRLNELRWRRRKDRSVVGAADLYLDPDTPSRVRGASATTVRTALSPLARAHARVCLRRAPVEVRGIIFSDTLLRLNLSRPRPPPPLPALPPPLGARFLGRLRKQVFGNNPCGSQL